MQVKKIMTAARAAELNAICQLTEPSVAAVVGKVATIEEAKVLKQRTNVFFIHCWVLTDILSTLFLNICQVY